MKLGDLLTEGAVLLDLESKDKWESIQLLVDRLVDKGRIRKEQRQKALDALVARERIASTGMEHGIAIPHATVDAVDEAVAAIGLSRRGIPFASADGKPATIVILLLIPRRSVQQHIRTLAGIARLLNFEEMRSALLGAKTEAELLQVIKTEEAEA